MSVSGWSSLHYIAIFKRLEAFGKFRSLNYTKFVKQMMKKERNIFMLENRKRISKFLFTLLRLEFASRR